MPLQRLKRWLARLSGGAAPATALAPTLAAPVQAAPAGADGPASVDPALPGSDTSVPAPAVASAAPVLDLDLAFFHWLTAPHSRGAAVSDLAILDELARLAHDPQQAAALVPRVPAVVPQLLRSLRDEDSSAGDLARQVAQDAVLVAEVIRDVNSPYYRPATPVRNLEGALLLLGQNGLRMLLARVAFRPLISSQGGPLARLLAPHLWSQSERCALAASLLAPRHGADPFAAYLAGLMHNIGLVVALRVIDQRVPGGHLPESDAFGTRLVHIARMLSARIATQWGLPAPIGQALAQLGQMVGDAGDGGNLAAALREADGLAKLHMLAASGRPDCMGAAAQLSPPLRQVFEKLSQSIDDQDR